MIFAPMPKDAAGQTPPDTTAADDAAGADAPAAPGPAPLPAARLLAASAAEAARLARALTGLDHDLASAATAAALPGALLQRVDLIRQEAAGLAAVLDLLARAPTPLLDTGLLARHLPLRAQLGRLLQE